MPLPSGMGRKGGCFPPPLGGGKRRGKGGGKVGGNWHLHYTATRAFRAVRGYAVGKRGRPRFKGRNQFDSVEGKTNGSGIRWRDGYVEWMGLRLRAVIPKGDAVVAHGLSSRVKDVRLIRRRLNGKVHYWAQLICEGQPYRKPKKHGGHRPGRGRPRSVGVRAGRGRLGGAGGPGHAAQGRTRRGTAVAAAGGEETAGQQPGELSA